MVNVYFYDISFMVVFLIAVVLFLYYNKKNIAREGFFIFYRAQWGVKAMDWFDKKFHRTLGVLRYVIVGLGYVLMVSIIFILVRVLMTYLGGNIVEEVRNVPPLMPIFPYFTEAFGLESFFPSFYFTYFLVSLAIVAIVHEFSHGIYMRYSKTKIKSTGILFLGPILGAFVEEDRKSFHSKDRLNQMAVLGAGVFANILFMMVFYFIYIGFIALSFSPAGFAFVNYAVDVVDVNNIDSISDFDENYSLLIVDGERFFINDEMRSIIEEGDTQRILAFMDSPAFKNQLRGVIVGVNDYDIKNQEEFNSILSDFSPGDSITIYTKVDDEINDFDIVLESHPFDSERAFLGISGGRDFNIVLRFFLTIFSPRLSISSTHYEANWNEGLSIFIKDLLWWVMMINFFVALFNMLPFAFLDGGRFFYLTVEKFTGEKIAEKVFVFVSRSIVFLFILIMLVWFFI